MSTLKRSRSFRASMKLMSKIRNHASLRLNVGFDFSPAPKERAPKNGCDLRVVEKSQNDERHSNPRKGSEESNSRLENEIDNETSSCTRKISVSSTNDVDSWEITRDLKNKLSLTDKTTTSKDRKCVEEASLRDGRSLELIRIFRKKHNTEGSQGEIQGKERNQKHVPREIDAHQPRHASYENPVFLPDSSLDTSVSSFLFEAETEERQQDRGDERTISRERDVLTVIVDTRKAVIQQPCYRRMSYGRDKSGNGQCIGNEVSRNTFRSRCETDPPRCSCKATNENIQTNVTDGNRRFAESFGEFDRPRIKFYYGIRERERNNAINCLQDNRFLDGKEGAICPSKSCRTKAVDNIASFWTSGRGGSFRSKITTRRKRDAKEAKDYERIAQERVLVSTSPGSSMLDQ